MKRIPIMFCFNNNYVIPASACFISIMEHASRNNKYVFNILHSDITEDNANLLIEDMKKFSNCELNFINMNNKYEEEYNKIENHSHFSKELLYKLSCASIFPKEEKIIITDVDVIFLDDIAKMYEAFDIKENYYYAGIPSKKLNKPSIYDGELYTKFNNIEIKKLKDGVGAGFLLVNLAKHREDNLEEKLMNYLMKNTNRLIQIEQDVINIVCYKKIKKMPYKFMTCSYEYDEFKDNDYSSLRKKEDKASIMDALDHPIQLHYATPIKPWIYTDCIKNEIWFEYFNKSVFASIYLESIKKRGKSANSFKVKFMKTRLYKLLLSIYHLLKKILKYLKFNI